MSEYSKTKLLRPLGILIALLTMFGTIIPLDINAYFHPEAALLILGGVISYILLVIDDKSLATRVGEGAIWFGWLGILFAWIYIAYTGFNEFNSNELGVSVAYSMHPLLYGYIIKFFPLAFDN